MAKTKTDPKILAEKKRLYHSDPEYRKRQIQRTIASRKKRQERDRKLKNQLKIERKQWRKLKIENKILLCCRIGTVAKAIGREVQTIRLWQRDGSFPPTITYKSHRYFTKYQHDLIVSLWEKHKQGVYLREFFVELRDKWAIK